MNIDTNATAQGANPLIASDRVEGTTVYGRDGEKLGRVERFMVNKISGQAEYAVMSFGGLLGIGSRHFPVPWKALDYEEDKGGYVVGLTPETLERAPHYDAEGAEPVYDRVYTQHVFAFYGLPYL
ncbi:PRC-barrel domain-containing protein [Sphingomonas sp.]|uniref:PRC-barrel domain-containing protein n=1 Tax=Sphingomonas sp. TaxID=28214 RepID=UPI001EB6D1AA|nr:PRC-barrel domain-containing protein [Sphingomonas sp.]MBX3594488.1 PRC-barrel domain-containing protein [Sphingomonas sp.]